MRSYGWAAPSILLLLATPAPAQTTSARGALIEVRLVRTTAAPGFLAMQSPGDTTLFVARRGVVSDTDIVEAHTIPSHDGMVVVVRFTPRAAARLSAVTKQHLGERLALMIDGELNGAPVVKSVLDANDTSLDIGVQLPRTAAHRLEAAIAARWPPQHR